MKLLVSKGCPYCLKCEIFIYTNQISCSFEHRYVKTQVPVLYVENLIIKESDTIISILSNQTFKFFDQQLISDSKILSANQWAQKHNNSIIPINSISFDLQIGVFIIRNCDNIDYANYFKHKYKNLFTYDYE